MEEKMIIYQVFTRLFGNKGLRNKMNGTLEENGCGKMDDFTEKALHEIKKLGEKTGVAKWMILPKRLCTR